METLFLYLGGLLVLWSFGVFLVDRINNQPGNQLLPPPDRSALRNAESFDLQDRYVKRLEKQQ